MFLSVVRAECGGSGPGEQPLHHISSPPALHQAAQASTSYIAEEDLSITIGLARHCLGKLKNMQRQLLQRLYPVRRCVLVVD